MEQKLLDEAEKVAARLDKDFRTGGDKREQWRAYVGEMLKIDEQEMQTVALLKTAKPLNWRAACVAVVKKAKEKEATASASKRRRS